MATLILENRKFVILFILILSFFLRLYHLGYHDFWYDEIFSVNYAHYPWANWNAPLYWILLHFWIKIFGISEFSLRFPSLIFNFLSIILVFLLGKSLFNKGVGIAASLFIGLSPFHLWYAQEARDYSMVLFFGTLSSYLFFKATKGERLKLWLSFVLVSILGLYTNYFYIFLLIFQGLYFVLSRSWRLNFKEIICFLVIALGFIPYLNRFLTKFYYVWGGFWIPKPSLKSLIITIENFILGYNASSHLYLISNLLLGLFFICAVLNFKKKELRESLIFCLLLFIFPILAVFIFSKLFFSIYIDRALIIFSPFYYIIIALGIESFIYSRLIKSFAITILLLLFLIGIYGYYKDWLIRPYWSGGVYIKKPIRPILEFIEDNLESQDIIAFTNESIIPSFEFYSENRFSPLYRLFDPKFLDTSWQRPIQESEYVVPFHKINNLEFKRLWVISSDWARSGKLDENSQSVKNWLDNNLKLEHTCEFDGLRIFRYCKDSKR